MAAEPGFQLSGAAVARYDRTVAPIAAPFVEAVLDAGNVAAGHAVLDVACGTGFAARAAAARVGRAGRVAGVDVNPRVLEAAAAAAVPAPALAPALAPATATAAAARAAAPAIEWHEASADDLPFPGASFDAVVCQQGLQFFSDLPASVAEAARVTRDGGWVAATVWSPLERSPYFAAQSRAVEEILGAQAGTYFARAFSCPAAAAMAAFRAAGLGEVTGREVVADICIPSAADFIPDHLLATPWGLAAAEARPGGVEQASTTVLALLSPFMNPDGSLTTPFASLLIAGRLPYAP